MFEFFSSNFYKFTFYASSALTIYNACSAVYNMKKDKYVLNRNVKLRKLFVCGLILFLFYFILSLIPFLNFYSSTYEYFHKSIEKIIVKTITAYNVIFRSIIPKIEDDKKEVDDAIKQSQDATSEIERLNNELNSNEDIVEKVYFTDEELSKLTPEELKKKIREELNVDRIEFYDEEKFIESIDEYLVKNGYKRGKKSIFQIPKKIINNVKKRVRKK